MKPDKIEVIFKDRVLLTWNRDYNIATRDSIEAWLDAYNYKRYSGIWWSDSWTAVVVFNKQSDLALFLLRWK